MNHGNIGHPRRLDENDLTPRRVHLHIFDASQGPRRDTGAVEHNARRLPICSLYAGKLLAKKAYTKLVAQLGVQILDMLGGIDAQRGE